MFVGVLASYVLTYKRQSHKMVKHTQTIRRQRLQKYNDFRDLWAVAGNSLQLLYSFFMFTD